VGHRCRDCPNRRLEKKKAVHVANLQKAQQEEWRRSPENALQQKAFEHCEEEVPEEADLCELKWSNRKVIVSYLMCEDCRKKKCHVVEDRGQGVVKGKEWEELKKSRECSKTGKGKAVCSIKRKVQQKRRVVKEKFKELSKY